MDTDIDSDVRLRVIHGMALLDPMWPNHVRRADLDIMDCADPWNCPLAQAAKQSYYSAYNALGFTTWEAAYLRGFAINEGRALLELLDAYAIEYGALTRAWKEAYTLRRNGDVVWTEYVHSFRERVIYNPKLLETEVTSVE